MPLISNRVSIRHVSALDGLRGAAVAGVLLFHGGHLKGGYLGVDLFFVLSGFLITSLLLSESGHTGSVRLGSFWARRARRLLPALGGLMVGIALYYLFIAEPSELSRIRDDSVATLGYFANWNGVFANHDYWAIFTAPSPLDHTWSLAIEEQFYLVWPLIFVGLVAWWKRKAPIAVFVTALCLAAVSTVLMFALYDPDNSLRVYYGTDTRATGILLGAALAAWFTIAGPARTRRARVAVEIGGIIGVAVLAVMWTRLDGQSANLYHGGFLLAGVAAIAVIAAAWHPDPGPISRVLSFKPLCLLGLISYGVYLWHWPVDLVLNEARVGLSGWPLFAVQLAATLAISIISYQLLEMPIRRGALSKRQWQVVVPILAAASIVVLAGAAKLEPTTGVNELKVAAIQDPPRVRPIRADIRRTVGPVVVVGDSVALSMASGLRNAGLDVTSFGYPACHVVRGTMKTSGYKIGTVQKGFCKWPSFWKPVLDRVQPNVVVLETGGWELYEVQPPGSTTWLVPGTRPWAAYFKSEMQAAVDLLSSTGARVVMPDFPCVQQQNPLTPTEWQNVAMFNPKLRRQANGILEQLAAENPGRLDVLDLDGFLCPSGRYQSNLHGVDPVRVDGVHFGRRGSNLVGRWIARQLLSEPATTPNAQSAG